MLKTVSTINDMMSLAGRSLLEIWRERSREIDGLIDACGSEQPNE